jgi:hypothetical protein
MYYGYLVVHSDHALPTKALYACTMDQISLCFTKSRVALWLTKRWKEGGSSRASLNIAPFLDEVPTYTYKVGLKIGSVRAGFVETFPTPSCQKRDHP